MTSCILTFARRIGPPRRVSVVEHEGTVTLRDLATGSPMLGASEEDMGRAREALARAREAAL